MKNLKYILIGCLFLSILACSDGEAGDIGPVGANGPKGPVGDKGDTGAASSKGMIVTPWLEVKPTDWIDLSTFSFGVSITIPSLSLDVINKGNVYIYMQPSGHTQVYALPYAEPNGLKVFGILGTQSNGTPIMAIYHSIISSFGSAKFTTNYKFRTVILPPGARLAAGVDWGNYDSVKQYLDLND